MFLKYIEWIKLLGEMKRYQKVDDYNGQIKLNHLYKFYPEGGVCSDGSPYHGLFRKGNVNKLIIALDGGGLIFDKLSAAYPSEDEYVEGTLSFYDSYCKPSKDAFARLGLFHEKCKKSPFYGWSLLYVPYANGDLHAGRGCFEYTDTEGKNRTFYAHGNINLNSCIDFIKGICPNPDQLVVVGCSAGGFGTAFVGNDILDRFPDCQDCTCIVDGAALELDYRECAEDLWQVPDSIKAQIKSSNVVADGLEYMYEHQKNRVKIGYLISIKDGVLTRFQNYIDARKEMGWPPEATERMHEIVSDTVRRLKKSVPTLSFFLYDYNFNDINGKPVEFNGANSHCCLWVPEFMRFKREGYTGIQWLRGVVKGETIRIGESLIKEASCPKESI